ncbi:MAG: hypothetical protein CM15mP49_28300 [Actinomycetota bacterium]|nr:MAG: hypothetical protein CM15mP49_28300 [Actinomycetota bacterium]
MSEPINISLPPSVDDFDLAIDTGWEYLRSYENVNRVFYTASALGDFSLIWHMLNLARRINNPERRGSVLELSLYLEQNPSRKPGLKRLFRRSRPDMGSRTHPHKIRKPQTSSFPSGHASSAVLAASILSKGSKLAPAYKVLAALVATSRIHVRAHHASDVIAGAAVGMIFTRLINSRR